MGTRARRNVSPEIRLVMMALGVLLVGGVLWGYTGSHASASVGSSVSPRQVTDAGRLGLLTTGRQGGMVDAALCGSARALSNVQMGPDVADAFAFLSPCNIAVTQGVTFTLDLMINAGTNVVAGQQSYLTLTNSLLRIIPPGGTCASASSTTVQADTSSLEVVLQNTVDNTNGLIAYASGTFGAGATGTFRVARLNFCAQASGAAQLNWQFSPPAPANRNSKITDLDSIDVTNRAAYQNCLVTIGSGAATSTPTQTGTPTSTRTITPTVTQVPVMVGHVNWEGRGAQPSGGQMMPLTLTLKSASTEVNYPGFFVTDASGFFTPNVSTLPTGVYSWRVKGPSYLSSAGSFTLVGGVNNVEMGMQRGGDITGDDVCNAQDFNVLRGNFELAGPGPISPQR